MNKLEYDKYEAAIGNFLSLNHVKAECWSPVNQNGESFFSWQACDCCNRPLGGTREEYQFATEYYPIALFTADICQDCVYYLEYGRLDDLTMLEMERNGQ
jgi:hypothetical protein